MPDLHLTELERIAFIGIQARYRAAELSAKLEQLTASNDDKILAAHLGERIGIDITKYRIDPSTWSLEEKEPQHEELRRFDAG